MKELFTNFITINTSLEVIQDLLKNPQHLLEWVPEVQVVEAEENHFHIKRTASALNQQETLTVEATADSIIYHSTGGRLEYDAIFKMTNTGHQMIVEQTLLLKDNVSLLLPTSLLAPIAKHAFKQNLNALKKLAEAVAYQD
ncbi:hypothetical protein [Liquorilactobacillus uvarum]|uniref:hypothetical protein n=1 Tax=Liquorilactobacillus uvarum TaxID=303240 RepID=UPI00288B6EED|nr:hypothetical protein [Liquorilactobacillus uvarum]